MDGKAVGRRIKEAREKRHLTQEELAARIDISPTRQRARPPTCPPPWKAYPGKRSGGS